MMPREQDLSPAHWGAPRLTVRVPILPGSVGAQQEHEAVWDSRRVRDVLCPVGLVSRGQIPQDFPRGHRYLAVSSPGEQH